MHFLLEVVHTAPASQKEKKQPMEKTGKGHKLLVQRIKGGHFAHEEMLHSFSNQGMGLSPVRTGEISKCIILSVQIL